MAAEVTANRAVTAAAALARHSRFRLPARPLLRGSGQLDGERVSAEKNGRVNEKRREREDIVETIDRLFGFSGDRRRRCRRSRPDAVIAAGAIAGHLLADTGNSINGS
ncbi:hypothetical protein L596_003472 [Steinernema carpocapsae]|uniref:Uncharacterized protein n=1 Tax=Steinernema carpocapsae TaxID=34508 RepID=A0A4U8USQ7_STECR|nr:hypothetical protein L596_003472 [Steinernema carpocapsae]